MNGGKLLAGRELYQLFIESEWREAMMTSGDHLLR
jgi:hypothetical protein